jgi:hypothetical protein
MNHDASNENNQRKERNAKQTLRIDIKGKGKEKLLQQRHACDDSSLQNVSQKRTANNEAQHSKGTWVRLEACEAEPTH